MVYSQSVRLPYFCFTITESKSTAQMLNTCTSLCCNLLTFVILVTFDLKSIKINIATQKIQYIMCQHIKNNKLCDFSTVTLRLLYLVWVNTFSNVICKQAFFVVLQNKKYLYFITKRVDNQSMVLQKVECQDYTATITLFLFYL